MDSAGNSSNVSMSQKSIVAIGGNKVTKGNEEGEQLLEEATYPG